MRLESGTNLGPYSIVSALGAGGMGEVYRARDSRLDREVALKILSAEFAEDAERVQRFSREAQILATLNHPHIAQIYGLEEIGGVHALVMELVDGEDLAARVGRGAIPIDEVLQIAAQVADALETAHEQGIVHRDLKPANVKIRTDGTAKVLDFGLAKTLDRCGLSNAALADSATIASPAVVTSDGMLLGTAPYMSPEQARGKAVDKRADIWAFGVVLYEMLTRRNPFRADTVTDMLSAVVSSEPDWNALTSDVPARVRWLLKRCLEKDPRLRLRDIGEARVVLHAGRVDTDPVAPVESSSPLHRRNVFARVLPWTVVALAVIAAVAAWSLAPAPGRPAPRNFELALPPEGTGFVLSPAGQHLAFFVADQVRIIDLRRLESRNLAPASSGLRRFIFWSPDSAFVGYNTADGKVWKVPVNGGAPLVVCDIPESGSLMGATWRADQSIVFAVWRGSLYQVPASGGQPTRLVAIDPAREVDFHHPVSLPDGRLLVTTHLHPTEENQATGNTRLEVLDGQQRHVVLGAGFAPVAYVNGRYLLVHRVGVNAGLWAFEFSGSSTLRPEDGHVLAPGAQNATAAQDGTILYSLPSTAPSMRELVWVDRAGRVTAQIGSAQPELVTPALSPDGGRIAYSARVDGNRDVWIHDLQTNFDSRLTFDSGDALLPAWFPSGRRLVYTELRAAGLNRLASRDADGSGERQELAVGMAPVVSPDGRYVLYLIDERGNLHLRYSEVSTDGALGPPRPVFKTSPEPAIYSPRLAPDGRFLAYEERPHGAGAEVFMTHFPSGEGRWQISRGGGTQPVWARDTGELMFLGGAPGGPRSLMAATIRLSPEVVIAGALKLFELGEDFTGEVEVTPDGKRFVMVRGRPDSGSQAIRWVLAQNWVADLPPTR